MTSPSSNAPQLLQAALQHHHAGRLREAEQLYRQILDQDPCHADALHMLGALAVQLGRNEIAVELIQKAIAQKPDYPEAYGSLGNAFQALGRLDLAIAAYQTTIQLRPNLVEAHSNLGNALWERGRLAEAIAAFRAAIQLKPDFADAYGNLSAVLFNQGEVDEAIAVSRTAIRLKPNLVEAHNNLGNALRALGELDEAIAAYRTAIQLRPDYAAAHSNLGAALQSGGQLDEALAAYRQAIAIQPNSDASHTNLILALNYHPDSTARAIYEETRQWDHQHAEPLRHLIQPHRNERTPDRRLRIGYVSPDFREHPVGRCALTLLAHHDHRNVEVFCYAQLLRPDAVTQELRAHADHWHDIVGLTDQQVADLVRQHQIDILVDLAQHTAGSRLLVFARKPAPVQVNYLGYPGTTGLSTIDYRLSDPFLDPPGIDESIYSEKTIRLSHTFWCYEPFDGRDISVNPIPVATNKCITFGCLNKFTKINDGVLRLWARVLHAVPSSRLLLLAPEGATRQHAVKILTEENIAPQRIEFSPHLPRHKYLELYHRIDVGLDTLPYNGHTTSLDSFWMGVPVVTLVGGTIVGRAGLSQLMNLKLPDLIAHTPDEFVQIAAGLANDPDRLAELRATLRPRLQQSPLMDAPRFARDIEAAYRQMWIEWCNGKQHPGFSAG